MAIFSRLSETFWSYVSPTKTDSLRTKTTPQTAPQTKSRPAQNDRRASLGDVVRQSRSMSLVSRVDSWRVDSAVAGVKRKYPSTPSSSAGRRRKIGRVMEMEGVEPTYGGQYEEDSDVEMSDVQMEFEGNGSELRIEDEEEDKEEEEVEDDDDIEGDDDGVEGCDEKGYDSDSEVEEGDNAEETEADDASNASMDDVDDLATNISAARLRSKSPSSNKSYFYDDELEHDTTLVVSEAEAFASPRRRKVINLPAETSSRGVSTEELQADGWCDEHIELVQKLALRGFEPLLPRYWKWDFTWLPDALFEESGQDDNAFVNSVRTASNSVHIRGIKALEKLFELGGRVRDTLIVQGNLKPEQASKKWLQAYTKWADLDADFDLRTAIPLLAIEARPANTPADVLQENARRKMAKLHARYREAFRAHQSIETSPGPGRARSSTTSETLTSHPVPQIYALIASHTLLALVAYRPDTEEVVKTVAFFDMKDKDYDVWNSLAMAIFVCHLRNVRVRVAEETGLGLKVQGEEVEVDDPDL